MRIEGRREGPVEYFDDEAKPQQYSSERPDTWIVARARIYDEAAHHFVSIAMIATSQDFKATGHETVTLQAKHNLPLLVEKHHHERTGLTDNRAYEYRWNESR